MSSSGSRGPPINRYNNDDYHKIKRKNFYPSRRNLSSSGPGAPNSAPSGNGGPPGSTGPTGPDMSGPGPGPTGSAGSAGSAGSRKSFGSKYNTYYPSYGSYNTFKRDRDVSNPNSTADSDPSSGGSSYSRVSDRYDSYSKNYSRPSLNNRSSLSNPVPKRDRSRNNSLLNSKRSDTYYPSKNYFSKSQVDHYSTKKKHQYQAPPSQQAYSSYSNVDFNSGYNSNYNLSYKKSDGDDSSSGVSRRNTESPNDVSNRYNRYDDEHNYNNQSNNNDDSYIKLESNEGPNNTSFTQDYDSTNNDDIDDNDGLNNFHDNENVIKKEPTSMSIDEKSKVESNDDVTTNTDNNNDDQVSDDDIQNPDQIEIDIPAPSINLEPGKDLNVKPESESNPHSDQLSNNQEVNGSLLTVQYPLNRMDALLSDLKHEFESQKVVTKYPKVHEDVKAYPFYKRNLHIYQLQRSNIVNWLKLNNKNTNIYKLKLWKEYKQLLNQWDKERINMDQQLKLLHPPNDEMKRELELADIRIKNQIYGTETPLPSTPNPNGNTSNGGGANDASPTDSNFEDTIVTGGFGNRRSSRRHGDLVTTEAEFEEVLKNLSKQDDDDPVLKALKVSATVPDLMLDPNERVLSEFYDSNNIVKNKQEWSTRVRTQFFDNFSTEEHALFCEGFVKYPKKFGYISKYMGGLRTTRECVIHYYLTKKGVNYKNLILQYKKKITKKPIKKKVKSRNVSVNTPSASANDKPEGFDDNEHENNNGVENDDNNPLTQETILVTVTHPSQTEVLGDALYTETGRRKRAAAPSFEDNQSSAKRNKQTVEVQFQPTSPTQSQVIDVKKKGNRKKREEHDSPLTPKDTPKDKGEFEPSAVPIMGPVDEGFHDSDSKDKLNNRNKGHSSYWSITEATEFPVLLKQYGKKWTTIADILATKTPTMVRNYYHRNCEKYNWKEIAEDADKRLEQKFAATVSKPENEEAESVDQQQSRHPVDNHQPQIHQPQISPQNSNQIPIQPQIHGFAMSANTPIMSPPNTSAPLLGTFGNHSFPPPQAQYQVPYGGAASIPGQTSPSQTPYQPNLPVHPMPFTPSYHQQPPLQSQVQVPGQPQHAPQPHLPSFNKPLIGSLINNDKPNLGHGLPPKESHKPSIMSLLNSDSPTKTPSTPEPPVKASSSKNNINSLLNSPSSNDNANNQP